jgi:outer membrane protein TolC
MNTTTCAREGRVALVIGSRSLMRGVLECLIAGVIAAAVAAAQSQFQGSVPSGTPSATPLALALHDTIDRGLRTNLGLLVSDSASEAARGQRLQALSALLPQLDARVSETIQQINLQTLGVNIKIPGVNTPDDRRTFPLHRRTRLRPVDAL